MDRQGPYGKAAEMLGRANADQNKLHPTLYKMLQDLDDMCARCGGELFSRQVIALTLVFWQNTHQGVKAIED